MNIYFRKLENKNSLLVKLIMQIIYKYNDCKGCHLENKHLGI